MNQQSQTTSSILNTEKQKTPNKAPSILNQFDLNPIKQIDPIFQNGYKESFSVRLQFLLKFLERQGEEQSPSTIELINIRLLTKKQSQKLEKFTIEVTTDNDLFFYFFHTIDAESYEVLKETQQLDGTFQQYYTSTQQFLEKCKTDPLKYACILNIRPDTTAYLQVIQTLNYKDLEILRYEMLAGDDDIVRQHVSFKYGQKRSYLHLVDGRIKDVNELVKLKNPQLLLHIQKILSSNQSNAIQQNGYQYAANQKQQNQNQLQQSNVIDNYAVKQ
ncbi:hypothetical protein ABPG72_013102 [Tetrahymena utriculariae]